MQSLLEMTWGAVVTVDGPGGGRCRVCNVAWAVSVAVVAETRLFRTGYLDALGINTAVCAFGLLWLAVRVPTRIWGGAFGLRTWYYTIWRADGVKSAILTEFFKAIVWKLTIVPM
jgi:hypothetical protein